VTGVIVVTIGGGFQVQAQDLVRVCARAERESQDRQNKFSHIWEYDPERFLMRLSGLNHVNRKVFTTVNLLAQGCFLPNHLDRILVFADPEKDGLPESIIACPFRESDLIGSTQRHASFRQRSTQFPVHFQASTVRATHEGDNAWITRPMLNPCLTPYRCRSVFQLLPGIVCTQFIFMANRSLRSS
jgi:hypothetical protein